jgi:hypothetical protein
MVLSVHDSYPPNVAKAMESDKRAATKEKPVKHRDYWVGVGLVCLVLGMGVVDYLSHSGTKATQETIKRELLALPLPRDTTQENFVSGYQPSKGSAARTVASGQSEREMCDFYAPILLQAGWKKTRDACYPASEPRVLASYARDNITFDIFFLRNNVSGNREYILQSHWGTGQNGK